MSGDHGAFGGAGELYDLAYGPVRPRTRRRVAGEWDDPTWICVEVDEEWMKAETERARGWRADPPPADGWLTPRQAAVRLQVSTETVRRLLREGTFPFLAEKVDREWRIKLRS